MIRYTKGPPPAVLTTIAATRPRREWNDLGREDRDPIRTALVRDQGWLCAYCQSRIKPEDSAAGISQMKIEHWIPRNPDRDAGIEDDDHHFLWSNLLGVCPGVSAERNTPVDRNMPHCDTSRGNATLFLHPVEGRGPDPREHLRYTKDGEVTPSAPNDLVGNDIKALNLNADPLVRARKATFFAAWNDLKRVNFAIGALRKLEQNLQITPGVRARPYAEFLRFHVRKKIHQQGHAR
jgi:uncharacterized protein (TIGR02646 family)